MPVPILRKTSLVSALTAICLALSAILWAGCGSGGDSGASSSTGLPDEIIIGAAIAKTGVLAPYDASVAAVEQLVKETNEAGGIDGHKLKLIDADTRSDPQRAVVAAEEVVEDGADVMLVTCEALTGNAEAEIAEEHDILNLTLCENAPGFGPPIGSRLSFSANPSLLSEASAGASFLHSLSSGRASKDPSGGDAANVGYGQLVRRPFLFRDTAYTYGKADCSGFEQTWKHLGGEIAGSADFKITDQVVSAQVDQLAASDADAVAMCSSPPGGAAAIKQIRAAGIDLPILASSGFDGTFWTKGISDLSGIYFTSNGSIYDPPDPATGRLLRKLRRAGVDTDVSTNLLSAYAAGQLILASIRETGTVEGNALADALEAKPHGTIVGRVAYTPEDHYPSRAWPIYLFKDRKPSLLTVVKPEFLPEYGG
jgi:branched-chain amino acid transport system substrate-binding protein